MLKHLRAFRERLRDRRRYEELVAKLERINADDVSLIDWRNSARGVQQVFGGGRR